MDIIQRLRLSAKALLTQLELHGQLARVEWKEEKNRLQKLVLSTLLGFSFLICLLFLINTLVIALTWSTDYRFAAIGTLITGYATGLALCVNRFKQASHDGASSFCATRDEITADIAMIKTSL